MIIIIIITVDASYSDDDYDNYSNEKKLLSEIKILINNYCNNDGLYNEDNLIYDESYTEYSNSNKS